MLNIATSIDHAFGLPRDAGIALIFWLVPVAIGTLTHAVLHLHARRSTERMHAYSPTVVSVMIGTLSLYVSASWLLLDVGSIYDIDRVLKSMGFACFLVLPVLVLLAPTFALYLLAIAKATGSSRTTFSTFL